MTLSSYFIRLRVATEPTVKKSHSNALFFVVPLLSVQTFVNGSFTEIPNDLNRVCHQFTAVSLNEPSPFQQNSLRELALFVNASCSILKNSNHASIPPLSQNDNACHIAKCKAQTSVILLLGLLAALGSRICH